MVFCAVKNETALSVCVCVCSGRKPCYVGIYQCGLWSPIQVCLCGDWRFVLTWLWEGCVSGGSWWRFKVLGVVCVCDQVSV